MKTFKQFICENREADDLSNLQIDEVVKLIARDCQPFLSELNIENNNNLLYRGLKGCPNIGKLYSRQREPRDSAVWLHKLLNSYLFKKFSVYFRSASVFVTPSRSISTAYGPTYYIFPIGQIKYCYDENIIDAYAFFQNSQELGSLEPEGLHIINEVCNTEFEYPFDIHSQKWRDTVLKYLNLAQPYTNKKLDYASTLMNEIMIQCDSYYAIRTDFISGTDLLKKVRDDDNI